MTLRVIATPRSPEIWPRETTGGAVLALGDCERSQPKVHIDVRSSADALWIGSYRVLTDANFVERIWIYGSFQVRQVQGRQAERGITPAKACPGICRFVMHVSIALYAYAHAHASHALTTRGRAQMRAHPFRKSLLVRPPPLCPSALVSLSCFFACKMTHKHPPPGPRC